MVEKTLSDLKVILALSKLPRFGIASFRKLTAHFSSTETLLSGHSWSPELKTLAPRLPDPDWKGVESDLEWAQNPHCFIITINSTNYPEMLRECQYPPLVLYVKGDVACLNAPQLSMVGSRQATPRGLATARYFAQALASQGVTITSGLAVGIDGESHRGALRANGKTIAVLGGGLERLYPKQHEDLANAIVKNGALVSQFAPYAAPVKEHFPIRNQVVSGLSYATLVVEAAEKSGSVITARLAANDGREVFAIPGTIDTPYAQGCHRLIQEGASLVTTPEDVFNLLMQCPGLQEKLERIRAQRLGDLQTTQKEGAVA